MVSPINTNSYSATTHGASSASGVSDVGAAKLLKGGASVGTGRFESLFGGAHADFKDLVQKQGTASFEELMSPVPL
ncbi:MAG TPA: hypothetical protein VL593_12765 [Ramlibacter sp.]|jgi:hypothetical protein|nr:hypothetical protein [Ramlibacter sp.]